MPQAEQTVRFRQVTATSGNRTTASVLVINTGYLKTLPGLLKLFIVVSLYSKEIYSYWYAVFDLPNTRYLLHEHYIVSFSPLSKVAEMSTLPFIQKHFHLDDRRIGSSPLSIHALCLPVSPHSLFSIVNGNPLLFNVHVVWFMFGKDRVFHMIKWIKLVTLLLISLLPFLNCFTLLTISFLLIDPFACHVHFDPEWISFVRSLLGPIGWILCLWPLSPPGFLCRPCHHWTHAHFGPLFSQHCKFTTENCFRKYIPSSQSLLFSSTAMDGEKTRLNCLFASFICPFSSSWGEKRAYLKCTNPIVLFIPMKCWFMWKKTFSLCF